MIPLLINRRHRSPIPLAASATTIASIIATIAVALLCALILIPGKPAKAQPADNPVGIYGEEFDFGYIPNRTTVKHTLYIYNNTDTTLRITKVNPGCGCTSIPLKQRVAQPGDTLLIDLLLDTGKIRVGEFQKSPRIYTDSRKRPVITCKLKGINYDYKGPDLLEVSPISVEMPRKRDSDKTTVSIYNPSELTLIPHLIEAPPPDLIDVVVPNQAIVPGRALEVSIKVKDLSRVKVDAIHESFTLAFNDPHRTRLTIPITVMK